VRWGELGFEVGDVVREAPNPEVKLIIEWGLSYQLTQIMGCGHVTWYDLSSSG
jgi:hypothetical protein